MSPGQVAYEAYTQARANEPCWSGTWPDWSRLVPARQQTWEATAQALLTAMIPHTDDDRGSEIHLCV